MKRVVTQHLKPPLKASSSLCTGIGGCSGNLISTSVVPLPISAGPQTSRAALLVRDCSLPEVQVGIPLTSMLPCLSPSIRTSFKAGGCGSAGSTDLILAAALKVIGVGFFFESTFGEKPPLYSTSRLSTRTFTHGAATAAAAIASSATPRTTPTPADLPQVFFITTSRDHPKWESIAVNNTGVPFPAGERLS